MHLLEHLWTTVALHTVTAMTRQRITTAFMFIVLNLRNLSGREKKSVKSRQKLSFCLNGNFEKLLDIRIFMSMF